MYFYNISLINLTNTVQFLTDIQHVNAVIWQEALTTDNFLFRSVNYGDFFFVRGDCK